MTDAPGLSDEQIRQLWSNAMAATPLAHGLGPTVETVNYFAQSLIAADRQARQAPEGDSDEALRLLYEVGGKARNGEAIDLNLDALTRLIALARASAAPQMDDDNAPTIECWNGEKKVTIYPTTVLRSWGKNIDTEMSDEPRTLKSVDDAMRWLYAVPDALDARDEDMFQFHIGAFIVDAGWYMDKYRCRVIENRDWEHPKELFETGDADQVIRWICSTLIELRNQYGEAPNALDARRYRAQALREAAEWFGLQGIGQF